MEQEILNLKYYFPELPDAVSDKEGVAQLIVDEVEDNDDLKYCGRASKEGLYEEVLGRLRALKDTSNYKPLDSKEKRLVSSTLRETARRCQEVVPHPDLPIFTFVFPWYVDPEFQNKFDGVNGKALHRRVIHIPVADDFTKQGLINTLVHEWTHPIFYITHPTEDEDWHPLLHDIVMEGIAEQFREDVFGGDSQPWSITLTKSKAQEELENLKDQLNIADWDLYQKIFFGSEEYKRWTGYSIGYHLIGAFRKQYPDMTWEEVVKTDPQEILKKTDF